VSDSCTLNFSISFFLSSVDGPGRGGVGQAAEAHAGEARRGQKSDGRWGREGETRDEEEDEDGRLGDGGVEKKWMWDGEKGTAFPPSALEGGMEETGVLPGPG